MPANNADPGNGLHTPGPAPTPYDQYRYADRHGSGRIYHVELIEQWIESDLVLDVYDWR
ncbi:hypothetical protein ACOZ4N_01110 (plasmid) [Halorientalis pallida]|uniref:hypothetical protein n=1 Tax=Halorientalis pallida TaxID=2479928 RepID=UPI003C6F4C23